MSKKVQKSKVSQSQAIAQLWEIGDLSYKLKGVQFNMRNLVYESLHDISVFLCSRQTGKCLSEGTLVATPYGSIPIEDLKKGDIVYGFNLKGEIAETEVRQVNNHGAKAVVD